MSSKDRVLEQQLSFKECILYNYDGIECVFTVNHFNIQLSTKIKKSNFNLGGECTVRKEIK